MNPLFQMLYIGCGGFLGAISRFLLSKVVGNYVTAFPLGTLLVNVLGCLLLGFILAGVTFGKDISEATRGLAVIGFLGAFTTMSTFASETMRLLELRNYAFFGLNLFLNIFLCLFAILAGKQLALLFFTR